MFPFKLELAGNAEQVSAQLSAHGDSQKIYLDSQLLTLNTAQAQGWIDLSGTSPLFDLKMSSAALPWPLQGEKQYASENARLTLQGSLDHYSVTLNSSVMARDLAAGELLLKGEGNAE